jgi:hypothetical protein
LLNTKAVIDNSAKLKFDSIVANNVYLFKFSGNIYTQDRYKDGIKLRIKTSDSTSEVPNDTVLTDNDTLQRFSASEIPFFIPSIKYNTEYNLHILSNKDESSINYCSLTA